MNTEPQWVIEIFNEQLDEYTYRICNDDLLNISFKSKTPSDCLVFPDSVTDVLHIYANGEPLISYLFNQCNEPTDDDDDNENEYDDVHNIIIHCSSKTDYIHYLIGIKGGHIYDVFTSKQIHRYGESHRHTDANSIYDTIYRGYLVDYFIDNDMEYDYHIEISNKVEFALDMKPELLEYFNGTKRLNPITLQLPPIIV